MVMFLEGGPMSAGGGGQCTEASRRAPGLSSSVDIDRFCYDNLQPSFMQFPLLPATMHRNDDHIRNEKVPIQLAQCWFRGLAISLQASPDRG